MKIMTFNALGSNREVKLKDNLSYVDARVERRFPLFNAMLIAEKPDVFGMQEVRPCWQNWALNGFQPAMYSYVLQTTVESEEGGLIVYNNRKYEEVEHGIFWLVEGAPTQTQKIPESHFDRMCAWVLLKEKETEKLFLFGDTHLDTIESVKARQAKVLCEELTRLKGEKEGQYGKPIPVILVGDMNSRPTTEPYQILTGAFRDSRVISAKDECGPTLATSPDFYYITDPAQYRNDGHLIDYILVTDEVACDRYYMVHTATNLCPYGPHISDHNAVFADLSF